MNNKRRNIIWEPYFIDDFEIDDDEIEVIDDLEDEDNHVAEIASKIKNLPKIMVTPFGPYRVDDSSNPLRRFDFWIAHTNFKITEQIFHTLNNMDGVEVMIVTTPYRFIIACGKLFNFSDVRVNIERELCGKHMVDAYLNQIRDNKILQEAKSCIDAIRTEKYWTVYILPNGYIHSFKTSNQNEFNDKCSLFQSARELSNGILITSEDDYDNAPNIKV